MQTHRQTAIYNNGLNLPHKSTEELKKLRAYKVAGAESETLIWLKYFLLFWVFLVGVFCCFRGLVHLSQSVQVKTVFLQYGHSSSVKRSGD